MANTRSNSYSTPPSSVHPYAVNFIVRISFREGSISSAIATYSGDPQQNATLLLETVVDFIQEYGNVGSVDEPASTRRTAILKCLKGIP